MITTRQVQAAQGSCSFEDTPFGKWRRDFVVRPQLVRIVGPLELKVFVPKKHAKVHWEVRNHFTISDGLGEAEAWEDAMDAAERCARGYLTAALYEL